MSARTGTLVTAPIRIADDTIQHPAVYSSEIEGGHQSTALLSDRDNIKTWHRRWGMVVTVYNDTDSNNNGDYVLVYGFVDTNLANNLNWVLKASGGVKRFNTTQSGNFSIGMPIGLILSIVVTATTSMAGFTIGYTFGGTELWGPDTLNSGENTLNINKLNTTPRNIYFSGITGGSVTVDIIVLTF